MMRRFTRVLVVSSVVLLAGSTVQTQAPAAPRPMTEDAFKALMKEVSNWGRWGATDQLGAFNLVTPETRKGAAGLVKDGVSVSLARDAEKEKAADVGSPYEHVMRSVGMDSLAVAYHGYAHTHLDALWHMADGDLAYNGVSRQQDYQKGAPALSVLNLKGGIFTRGVLVDIPRLKNVKYLEPGTAIYPEDLDAWEKVSGVRIGPGDAVFIYTGRWARRAAVGPWNIGQSMAGPHASVARWLKQRDIAFLGHDGGNEVEPTGVENRSLAMHQLILVAMGAYIFDNCDLEAVAAAAAERKRWEFLLTAAPLPIPGGTGSPLNPIATF